MDFLSNTIKKTCFAGSAIPLLPFSRGMFSCCQYLQSALDPIVHIVLVIAADDDSRRLMAVLQNQPFLAVDVLLEAFHLSQWHDIFPVDTHERPRIEQCRHSCQRHVDVE